MPQITTHTIETEEFTVSEIIGNIPGRFLYSGITMIAIVTATILVMSHFIHYPDKIISVGSLTSDTPPIEVVSRTNGFIEDIICLLYTSPSPRDRTRYRMPSSA